MGNLCIIPARGGSKRIHRKNIKDFLGKPIIAYSITTAIESKLFDKVMVSTDDEEIAEIARQYGAEVPFFRSKEASNDFAILNDVLEEVISSYEKIGQAFDNSCILFATSPLVTKNSLQKGLDLLTTKNFDSVRPVLKFSYPIQRAFRLTDGKVEMMQPENYRKRSQDLESAYHDAGQFYWISKSKSLLDTNKGAFVIDEMEAQDIDELSDWQMAELKYQILHKQQ